MRQCNSRGRIFWAVAALAFGAASPAPAQAQPVIAWSTYLRAGPAETETAIAELEHDTPVSVTSCAGGWCRVSAPHAQGYVDQSALTLARTPAAAPRAQTDCVTVGQADNRKPIATRFCSPAPPAR